MIDYTAVATVTGDQGHNYLNEGSYQREVSPGVFQTYYLATDISRQGGTYDGKGDPFTVFGTSRWNTIKYAGAFPFTADNEFRIDLKVTDKASGASGTATFFGAVRYLDYGHRGDFAESFGVDGPSDTTLRLGGDEFDIHIDGRASVDRGDVSVSIDARAVPPAPGGAPARTPEPATLALAGLGLAAAAAGRRFRREKSF